MSNKAPNNGWWRGGVIYQIYPRSFQDSNGDGIGDLPGITQRLDHIAALGADGIWISPFFKSPMKDFGYDVSDYNDVDPMFGTLDDFRALVARAHALGLKVMIDQVLSHCSDQHPWFVESRSSRDNPKADWFVWADAKDDGNPPNNWLSIFGGSAWQWDTRRCQYYLHNFLTSQPDLNFHHPAVQDALLDTVKFWLDLGVDGYRLDTVNFFFHDAQLRDNPGRGAPDPSNPDPAVNPYNPYGWQRHVYDKSRPENLPFLQRLRALLDQYPDTTMVGEIGDDDGLARVAEYTAGGEKLHMAYCFDLLGEAHDAPFLHGFLSRFNTIVGDGWPCWALSNHDVVRSATRWGGPNPDPRLLRLAAPVPEAMYGTAALEALIADMFDTMQGAGGVGLAAPQIGIDLQLVIFGFEESDRYPDAPAVPRTILLNPVITPLSQDREEGWEGCLSVPGLRGVVERHSLIRYTGVDPDGQPIDRTAEGFHARVVQHECDHLIGKLYPMRITDFSRFGYADVLFPGIGS